MFIQGWRYATMFGRCRDNLVHTSTSLSHDGMLQSNARSPVISPSLWYLGLARIFVKGRKTAPTKWLDHMPRTARDYNVYFAVHRYISGVNTSKRVRWQAILVNLPHCFLWGCGFLIAKPIACPQLGIQHFNLDGSIAVGDQIGSRVQRQGVCCSANQDIQSS